jgi:alkyl hydroperoxide reductase subunit F
MYDVIIIGAGPAGAAAGVYAARKRLKSLLIAGEFGGQSVVSETIYNWIGTPEISGNDLAKSLEKHLRYYEDNDILTLVGGSWVSSVTNNNDGSFTVVTNKDTYQTKTILVASGSARRKIDAIGADALEHKGLTYCASCDGPLFSGMEVAVIGGGNAGFETAAQLAAYCSKVTLLHRNDEYRADAITVQKVLSKENVVGVLNAETLEITGDVFVNGIRYRDKLSGEETTLAVQGIFVEVGQIPNTSYLGELVNLNPARHVIVDPYTQKSSLAGIWAAGDVTDVRYHQNNIAAGDAVKAIEDIYQYIHA